MQKALRNTIALITATWLSLLALPVQPALADLFINIHQDGNDVNMYWGGSITFTRARGYATRFVGPTGIFVNKITTDPGEINLLGAFTGIDLECPCADIFASVAGLNGKSQTLVGGKFNLLSSSGVLLLPKEYESGQVFSGTLKLHNVSINDYVLKTDVYKFKPDWSNDKIYITVVQEPNVTLTSTASSQVNGSYPMKATFSTDVYGFTASDIVVDNGTVSNFKQVSGRVYTFDVTPSQDGTVTVTVPANVATDRVGGTQADNNNQASKLLFFIQN